MRRLLLIVFATLSQVFAEAPAAPEPGTAEETKFNEAGEMIIFGGNVDKAGKKRELTLTDDYGLIIRNRGTYDQPEARYVIADRKAKTMTSYDSEAGFRAALAKIPKKTLLVQYDLCSTGSAPGRWRNHPVLKKHPVVNVMAMCKKLGIRFDTANEKCRKLYCCCPG